MSTPLRALAALALLLFAACDSPLDPERVAGTYLLQTVDGAPLPAVTVENPGARVDRLSDLLELREDGTGRQQVRHRVTLRAPGSETTEESATWEFHYVVRSGRVEITYQCAPNALCAAGPHLSGGLRDGRLVLRHAGELGAQEFIYRRFLR